MLNVNMHPLIQNFFDIEGYIWEFKEKMITLRSRENEPLFELIYDEHNYEIIVLTRYNVYYAKSVTISANRRREPDLYMKIDGRITMASVKVQKN